MPQLVSVPEQLEGKLEQNRGLRAAVDGVVADFSAWFQDSRTPFFPDYTDHGVDHVSGVLRSAVGLMSVDAKELITSNDAAVLILAAILHDSALHLSEDGFYALIKGTAANRRIEKFDLRSWPELWDEFLYSARRWDDAKLIDVFGKNTEGAPLAHVEDPFLNFSNVTDGQKKLIGEFLRKHHPRLAHEIALFGVPSTSSKPIQIGPRFEKDVADIAGLVARSHGLPLRSCIDYLSRAYNRREYQGIHAVYLMTLLRIADYLQIDASRAPSVTFQYRHIPSRVSVLERLTHAAVKNITATHDDPESLLVQAQPADINVFLKLRSWLAGIQNELDSSWAILGEVYGANSALSKLGLRLRRIRSNLIDDDEYVKTLPFIAEKIRFDVARAELLTLLIKPLYGNRPDIGVRELMQNAIDAVLERKDAEKRGAVPFSHYRKQEADVVVWLEDADSQGEIWLRVSDTGAGMTEEIVRDYFLRAGASFRRSDAWKQDFEDTITRGQNSERHSRILRSGRFGVGALAAFLLGEELEVTTRHISKSYGLKFRTKLEAEAIHIEKVDQVPVGTEIRVKLSRHALADLRNSSWRVERPGRFDWFCYDEPSCVRISGKNKARLKQRYRITLPTAEVITNWRHLETKVGYEVYWSYQDAPALTCNGIFVNNSGTLHEFGSRYNEQGSYALRRPSIAIKDPDAQFPLSLQRTQYSLPEYPFEESLALSVIRDFIAWILLRTPIPGESGIFQNPGWHPAVTPRYPFPFFATTEKALTLLLPNSLRELEANHICLLELSSWHRSNESIKAAKCDTVIYMSALDSLQIERDTKTKDLSVKFGYSGNKISGIKGIRFFTRTGSHSPLYILDRKKELTEQETGQWTVVATKGCPNTGIDFDFSKPPVTDGYGRSKYAAVELFLDESLSVEVSESMMSKEWTRLFGNRHTLPFDISERRLKYSKAFEDLKSHIAIYESPRRGF